MRKAVGIFTVARAGLENSQKYIGRHGLVMTSQTLLCYELVDQ